MSLNVNGILVIPEDFALSTKPWNQLIFFNFRAVSQNKQNTFVYWDCNLSVPLTEESKWREDITPGAVFYVEWASASSVSILDGKYHPVKINLDVKHFKRMKV